LQKIFINTLENTSYTKTFFLLSYVTFQASITAVTLHIQLVH